MIDAALLLPKILARAGDNAELAEIAVQVAWRRAVGENLRDHAAPMRLENKTLIVSVADAVWQKQLKAMSAELIFRVNKLLQQKAVDRLEFRIDPQPLSRRASQIQAQRESLPPPAAVVSAAGNIADPDLRERFMRAASNCIERREHSGTAKSAVRHSQPGI